MKRFTILGGGIAGLTAAIALRRIGVEAQVFEAAPAFKPVGAGLSLAANAMQGYARLGIAEKIIARGCLLPGFSILDDRGRLLAYADADAIGRKYGVHNFAIHRAELHEALLAELDPAGLHTGHAAERFERRGDTLTVHFKNGAAQETDYLIAADGIHSPIRRQLFPSSTTRYAGYTCWRAVIDNPGLDLRGATESWGAGSRFGIVPLAGNKIYWFACLNAPQNDPAMKALRAADLQRLFGHFHAPIPTLLQHTPDEALLWNDIIDLQPIERYQDGNIALIGDAAHATTPNLGQGACQAIEDAVILADELARRPDDPAAAFAAFTRRRLARTHGIVHQSWRLGKMAQWSHPLLIALRNSLMRLVPDSVNERQLKAVLEVDF